MNYRQKRRYPRVPVDRPSLVRVLDPEPFQRPFEDFTRTRVLGPGGCMFLSSEPVGFGSLMEMLITLGERVVRADSRVVYEIERGSEHEVGVEFLRMSPGDRAYLESVVAAESGGSAGQQT